MDLWIEGIGIGIGCGFGDAGRKLGAEMCVGRLPIRCGLIATPGLRNNSTKANGLARNVAENSLNWGKDIQVMHLIGLLVLFGDSDSVNNDQLKNLNHAIYLSKLERGNN
jgi:hypothetical protein